MKIGGLQKFSLLDYPGHLSAIIFTQGCNFRCQFCYNPMLVWPERQDKIKYAQAKKLGRRKGHPIYKEDDLFVFLRSRVGKLDAVVITGGEPTIQKDLGEFIAKIKKLGFLVKLDTNGTNPDMLLPLLAKERVGVRSGDEPLVDYIAMDIKAPLEKYKEVVGFLSPLSLRAPKGRGNLRSVASNQGLLRRSAPRNDSFIDFNKIVKSAKIIMESGLPYEFRTTVVPGLLNKEDIAEIGKVIKGADKWYLQKFRSQGPLVNKKFEKSKTYSYKELEEMCAIGRKYVKKCEVR